MALTRVARPSRIREGSTRRRRVGSAITTIMARRAFAEAVVVADHDVSRAEKAVAAVGDARFTAARVNASDEAAVRAWLAESGYDVLLKATDPRFVMPLFRAALAAGATYVDMAMSLSHPHPKQRVQCVNVEHEEVLLMPRWVDARRVTFKYGLGTEFIDVLKALHKTGLDSTMPVRVGGTEVSPRDVVAAVLPDPAGLGELMSGRPAPDCGSAAPASTVPRGWGTSTTWSTTPGR